MSTEYEWLNTLKPGDKVIRRGTGIGSMDEVVTVDRVTAAQIIIGSEKYRKANGRRMGDSGRWYTTWLKEATPKLLESIAYQKRHLALSRRLQDTRWAKLPLPLLEAVATVLDKHKAEQEKLTAALEREESEANAST